jgi:hypothetical protein
VYALQKKKPDMLGDLLNAQAEADGGKIPNVFLSISSALLAQICELDSVAVTINGPKYYIARVGLIILPEDHRIAPHHRYVECCQDDGGGSESTKCKVDMLAGQDVLAELQG